MKKRLYVLASLLILLTAFSAAGQVAVGAAPQTSSTGNIPLTDMGSGTYLGFSGGLYPGASNTIPSDHLNVGLSRGRAIRSAIRRMDVTLGMKARSRARACVIGLPPPPTRH